MNNQAIGPGETGYPSITDKKRNEINKVVKKHKERIIERAKTERIKQDTIKLSKKDVKDKKFTLEISKASELEARVKIIEERMKTKDMEVRVSVDSKEIQNELKKMLEELVNRIDKIENTIRKYGIYK
jgi:hypothetical protein